MRLLKKLGWLAILTVVVLVIPDFRLKAEEGAAETSAAPAEPAKKKAIVKRKKMLKSSAKSSSSVNVNQAQAASKAEPRNPWQALLADLKKRVNRTQAKQNQLVAVAAVRGAEATDAPPLYWKGKKSSGNVDPNDLKQFEEAIDSALAGDPDTARQKLGGFIETHPQSPLVADAKAALSKMEQPAP